ncbi:MAG: hypothetical protein HQL56_08340 [Magnetococcales bacterium]|nr:hypothetical protein [Magnetococcales bacterium]
MSSPLRFAVLGLLLGACATPEAVTNVALVDPSLKAAPNSGAVLLLSAPPGQPYREIARLETIGNEQVSSEVFLMEKMRTKAAQIGADAIITSPETTKEITNEFNGFVRKLRVLKGVAITFDRPHAGK